MVFPDFGAILNEVVALGIVLVPVEILILRNIAVFRLSALRILDAIGDWLVVFKDPEQRGKIIKEISPQIGHGLLRAFKEESGSAKGVGIKADSALNIASALGGDAGALLNLPGKIELPVVGKVTIGEAITMFNALRGVMSGKGLAGLTAGSPLAGGASGSSLP